MAILVVEGEQVSGAVDNAASISCLDKDGNKSNVQAELDKKGSGGGSEVRKMTQAAYDALPEEEQNSGMYLIEDGGELTAKNLAYDDTETQLGVNNVQDAIVEQGKKITSLQQLLEGSGLATSESGSTTVGCLESTPVNGVISFTTPFNTIPTVIATYYNSAGLIDGTITITEISKGGFSYAISTSGRYCNSVTISWNATADIA